MAPGNVANRPRAKGPLDAPDLEVVEVNAIAASGLVVNRKPSRAMPQAAISRQVAPMTAEMRCIKTSFP